MNNTTAIVERRGHSARQLQSIRVVPQAQNGVVSSAPSITEKAEAARVALTHAAVASIGPQCTRAIAGTVAWSTTSTAGVGTDVAQQVGVGRGVNRVEEASTEAASHTARSMPGLSTTDEDQQGGVGLGVNRVRQAGIGVASPTASSMSSLSTHSEGLQGCQLGQHGVVHPGVSNKGVQAEYGELFLKSLFELGKRIRDAYFEKVELPTRQRELAEMRAFLTPHTSETSNSDDDSADYNSSDEDRDADWESESDRVWKAFWG